MKINTKDFVSFLSKATLNGSIMTCVLRGNKIWTRSLDNSVAVFAEMKQDIGMTLPIKDSALLLRVLKSFGTDVLLERKENILKIYDDKKEAEIVLASEEFITNELQKILEPDTLQFDAGFSVPAGIFTNAISNFGVIKAEKYTVKVASKEFKIIAGQKGFDNFEEKTLIGEYPDCSNRFSDIINDVFTQLEGDVKVHMKSAYPMKIAFENDKLKTMYYVAPLDAEE